MRTVKERIWNGSAREDEDKACWLWQRGTTSKGYGTISVGGKALRAHRASYGAFNGPIPDGLQVRHTCDVNSCVNPDHLILGTQADNMKDKAVRRRAPSGDDHPLRKNPQLAARGERSGRTPLKDADVLEIRRRYAEEPETTLGDLGREYRVERTSIGSIVRRETWVHIGGAAAPEDRTSKRATGNRHGSVTKPEARPRGSNHPRAKITEEQALEIRERFATGTCTKKGMAREYGIDGKALRRLLYGETWAHVGGPRAARTDEGKPTPDKTKKAILEDYASGLTYDKIAERRSVGWTTVGKIIRAAGKSIRRSGKGNAHLGAEQVLAIRNASLKGATDADLAEKYSCTQQNIHLIVTGKTWQHVSGPIRL